ncbi:hypothetical protein D3C87_1982210 [compost metagenome]
MAQNERGAIRQDGLELAVADLGIEQVEPRRIHFDQHVIVMQRGIGTLAET